jgi:hypothetical protein
VAHTYIILSATSVGDMTTITGTVDTIPVTITVWKSAITQLPNTIAVNNFIFPLMLAQAFPSASAVVAQVPIETVTQ